MRRTPFQAPHFVEEVKERLPSEFRHGTEVETTLDLPLQHRVEEAVRAHVAKMAPRNLTQAAAVVIRNNSGVIVGPGAINLDASSSMLCPTSLSLATRITAILGGSLMVLNRSESYAKPNLRTLHHQKILL